MSNIATHLVWEYSYSRGNTKLLLLKLAYDADLEHLLAAPSFSILRDTVKRTKRSVYRYLNTLERRCEIVVLRDRGRHNHYMILHQRSWDQVFATLTSEQIGWDHERAIEEMDRIHNRVVTLFRDPGRCGLRVEHLESRKQLLDMPGAYRLTVTTLGEEG